MDGRWIPRLAGLLLSLQTAVTTANDGRPAVPIRPDLRRGGGFRTALRLQSQSKNDASSIGWTHH